MFPVHPTHEMAPMEQSIITAIFSLLFLGTLLNYLLGNWDKFIATAVAHFPIWHWGG